MKNVEPWHEEASISYPFKTGLLAGPATWSSSMSHGDLAASQPGTETTGASDFPCSLLVSLFLRPCISAKANHLSVKKINAGEEVIPIITRIFQLDGHTDFDH